jgi:uncharacterized cupin superfamily protein
MTFVTHWDDIEPESYEIGPLRATGWELGRAAGTVVAGVNRFDIAPGGRSAPVHKHGRDEEHFFILDGTGLSYRDGETCPVVPGDALLHRPGEDAHTLIAGDGGLSMLVFGPESRDEATVLPRIGLVRINGVAVAELDLGEDHPWDREAAAGELVTRAGERPHGTIHYTEAQERQVKRGRTDVTYRDIGRTTGSTTTGLRHATIAPGMSGPPPHCHSAEEEIFVVLDGTGTVTIGEETTPVRRGSIVGRPPGTGVAHQLSAGDDGLVYLAWSTRDPNDIVYFPRSKKVILRGVGVIARVEPVDYWDGEL